LPAPAGPSMVMTMEEMVMDGLCSWPPLARATADSHQAVTVGV